MGHSRSTQRGTGVLTGVLKGVLTGALTGVLTGVRGVLEGHSQGYSGARRPPAERTHPIGENAYNVDNAATASSAASLGVFIMDTMLLRQSRRASV